ncbi:MAG TPA: endonuclease/exonuclease/phosphatase family protein [Thermomicrobiaceae bacterium]|nr:endonuclease/exonuclease/phosphatase family protein [Thermomicrobiaceae bacterium]
MSWNIRAGGGRRVPLIAEQLAVWTPDIVMLCEFRDTPPSRCLAETLAGQGLAFQAAAIDASQPGRNGLLVASRWPVRCLRARNAPAEPCRWLLARIDAPAAFTLGAMHIPNEGSDGRKVAYWSAIERLVRGWRRGPGLLIGDTNSGRPIIDEESPVFGPRYDVWFDSLHRSGWVDAFRHLHGDERVYTWYSPNAGNGFRLDQAFINRRLLPRLQHAGYEWGTTGDPTISASRTILSDHAALLLDIDDGCSEDGDRPIG